MSWMSYAPVRLVTLGSALGLAALVSPACSGNPAAGLCHDVCDCQGCSKTEEEDCVDAADKAQQDAADEGCSEELDTYVTCLEDAFKCDDGDAVFTEDCASEAQDLADCGGTVPGVGDPCERAAAICGAEPGQTDQGQCTGQAACAAQCIIDANSCDFSNNQALVDCLTSCSGGL